MKRILSALLSAALLLCLFPVGVFAAEDVYINSQEAVFPSDCTVGDLYITGDCPENIILINVKIMRSGKDMRRWQDSSVHISISRRSRDTVMSHGWTSLSMPTTRHFIADAIHAPWSWSTFLRI